MPVSLGRGLRGGLSAGWPSHILVGEAEAAGRGQEEAREWAMEGRSSVASSQRAGADRNLSQGQGRGGRQGRGGAAAVRGVQKQPGLTDFRTRL